MKPYEREYNREIIKPNKEYVSYAVWLERRLDRIEKDRDTLLDAIKNIEKLCDGHNPDHAHIWGVCYSALNRRKV